MDRELKALLGALLEGQIKLSAAQSRSAEGQAAHERRLVALERGMQRLVDGQNSLVEGQARLLEGQSKLFEGHASLTARVDRLADLVVRGFTQVAERQAVLETHVTRLETPEA